MLDVKKEEEGSGEWYNTNIEAQGRRGNRKNRDTVRCWKVEKGLVEGAWRKCVNKINSSTSFFILRLGDS